MTTKTYYWDFFGPQGHGTATHFAAHLQQFLERHGIEGCSVDVTSQETGHHAARCRAPEAAWTAIEESLRPRRAE